MLKPYSVKSSAIRAAKKEFGQDWESFAEVFQNADGSWSYDTKNTKSPDPDLLRDLETTATLVQIDEENAKKKAKKAEIESRKPSFIPAIPIHKAVAEETAPPQAPELPAFLKIAPPAIPKVPFSSEGDLTEREIQEMEANADKLANAAVANVDPLKPRVSTADRPTKKVWHIADSMPNAKRKDVIEECVRQGIAYGTARTQYQHWFKCINDQKTAPIAKIGADGKIVFPK